MKRILSLLLLAVGLTLSAYAQMSDDQVVSYIKEQAANGKDQTTIAKDLIRQGVSTDQLERLKNQYEQAQAKSTANKAAATANGLKEIDRSRKPNGEMPEDDTAEDTQDDEEATESKIFGHDIFRSKNLTFEPNMNIATPSNYTLGPGDEVILDIYGASQSSQIFTVSPDGQITIPEEGPVSVAGLTVTQAQAKVQKKIGAHYQDSAIKLTIGQTRTILVNVMGEVMTPGSYTLSAFATVFNALYMAGGVNDIGTMRNIKVSRNGKIISEVDIYDYIINGKLAGNVMLRDNDVILVGPYQNLVSVEGSVKRPMLYEMKSNESVQSLLEFCGGFTGDAYKQKIRVERKSDDGLTVHNIDEWDFKTFQMEDGDVAVISNIIERYNNTVTISGAVFRPGMYKLGDKVSGIKTLVEQAGGLQEKAVTNRAVLHRMKADRTLQAISIDLGQIMDGNTPDMILQNEDVVIISSTEEIDQRRSVNIQGNVMHPGNYTYAEDETIEDLITEAGGLTETASIYNIEVARRLTSPEDNPDGKQMAKIFNLTISKDLRIDSQNGFKLQPFDIVTVHRNPDYQAQRFVFIDGEVKYTGAYIMASKEERLSDIIKRAGGITPNAYADGAQLIRKFTEKEQKLKQIKLEAATTANDSINAMNSLQHDTYNVGIDLKMAIENAGSLSDIVLAEGDSIYVPRLNNTVKISGEVLYPNTVAFSAKKKASYYLGQAGGISKTGRKRNAYIIYANGMASPINKGKILPGCEIVVPTKTEKPVDSSKVSMWAALTSAMATVGAVITSALK